MTFSQFLLQVLVGILVGLVAGRIIGALIYLFMQDSYVRKLLILIWLGKVSLRTADWGLTIAQLGLQNAESRPWISILLLIPSMIFRAIHTPLYKMFAFWARRMPPPPGSTFE